MRFASTTLGSPATAPVITVTPQGGSNFAILNPASAASMQQASETALIELQQARMYGASIVGTAAAANKAIAELNNPNASGTRLWVYALDFFVPVAMAVNVLLSGTTLAPAGTGFNLQTGGAGGLAKVGGGNQLAPTGSLIYTSPTLAANVIYTIPLPWFVELTANTNMQLQGQTVNQAFTCNVRWAEL